MKDINPQKPRVVDKKQRFGKIKRVKKPRPITIPDSYLDEIVKEPPAWHICHPCYDKGVPRKPYKLGGCLYPSNEILLYHQKNKCKYWNYFDWNKHYDI